jgi:hypothetical protein
LYCARLADRGVQQRPWALSLEGGLELKFGNAIQDDALEIAQRDGIRHGIEIALDFFESAMQDCDRIRNRTTGHGGKTLSALDARHIPEEVWHGQAATVRDDFELNQQAALRFGGNMRSPLGLRMMGTDGVSLPKSSVTIQSVEERRRSSVGRAADS